MLNAVRRLATGKAAGPDTHTNELFKGGLYSDAYISRTDAPWLRRLTALFNSSLSLGYYPDYFRDSIIVVRKKPGPKDLTAVKSYRPIALLNTLGKVMEAIIAERLQYLFATKNILPPTHLGGRKGISSEDALHTVTEHVYRIWQSNQVAAALSLDISGAFNNVSHVRLLHNLRKRGIGGTTLQWIASFLEDRRTQLRLLDYLGQPEPVEIGIPQLPGPHHSLDR